MTTTNEPAGLGASHEIDWDSAQACFPTIDRRYLAAAQRIGILEAYMRFRGRMSGRVATIAGPEGR